MKTVLITGGSRGIGKAMVKLFSEKGYRVAFTYKSSDEEALLLSKNTGALPIKADSENEDAILRACSIVCEKIGAPDILINNVGISSVGLVTDLSIMEWNRIFNINVTSAFLYSKCVLPEMINKKSGRIINISSMWGVTGASCEVAYSASKAALIGFTKALAKEVGPSGITVNCIAPGVISTDMNSALSQSDLDALKEETPLMKIGAPEDVASSALFLSSDEAGFITGAVLNVNGGIVI